MKRPQLKKLPSHKRVSNNATMPFYRELCAVQIHYDKMASALDKKDPARVHITSCDLVLAWIQVEVAFIRFIEFSPVELGLGHKALRERLVVTGSNHFVRGLFRRALDEMSNWAAPREELQTLRIILRWLHERLGLWSVVELPVLPSERAARNMSRARGTRRQH